MSETTTTAARAANKAGKALIDTVAEASDHALPQVVETAELAMTLDLPSKIVVRQGLVVGASIVGGAALGAGILFGVNKLRERRALARVEKNLEADLDAVKNA